MEDTKFKFTDQRLRKLAHDGSNKRIIYFDTVQHGLALQLTKSGTKTFQLRIWDSSNKKTVIKSLRKYPATSIQAARDEVAQLVTDISKGIDVIDRARSVIEMDTFGEMFSRWIKQQAKQLG